MLEHLSTYDLVVALCHRRLDLNAWRRNLILQIIRSRHAFGSTQNHFQSLSFEHASGGASGTCYPSEDAWKWTNPTFN